MCQLGLYLFMLSFCHQEKQSLSRQKNSHFKNLNLNRGHRSEKTNSILIFCRPIMRFGRIYRTTIIHGHESKYVHKHPTWVQNRIFLFRKSNFGGRQRCRWQQWIRNRLLWWRNETQITLAWRRRGLKNFWKYFDFRCKNVLFYSVWPNARN